MRVGLVMERVMESGELAPPSRPLLGIGIGGQLSSPLRACPVFCSVVFSPASSRKSPATRILRLFWELLPERRRFAWPSSRLPTPRRRQPPLLAPHVTHRRWCLFSSSSSMRSGKEAEIEVKVQPRRTDSMVHPLQTESSSGAVPRAPQPPLQQTYPSDEFRPFRKWIPWMIPTFVIANIAVFAITMYVNDCPKRSSSCIARFLGRFSFQPFKENPLLGPSSSTLQRMGALDVKRVVEGHQWWRLISCIWLHAGVFHILANMLGLLFIGIRLEQEFGFLRVGLIYLLSGLGGSLLSSLFILSSISVGASGALFGLLGAMLSELITNWTIYANKLAALLTLVLIIAINLGVGILPHVDNFAHIGGFLSGFLLGFVFLIRPQFGWVSRRNAPLMSSKSPAKKHKTYQYVLWVVAVILLIVWFVVAIVMVARGVNGNDHCSWCRYLSCVPTSKWSCRSSPGTCKISQRDALVSLMCQDTGKSKNYTMPSVSETQLYDMCIELCS